MLNMIDQCERYMAWIKHYASKLAYLLWLTPSGQVAHATLDRRLCRTRIFNDFACAGEMPLQTYFCYQLQICNAGFIGSICQLMHAVG